MPKPKVIAVVGPTASGKTSLAIEIAKRFSGEVVSVDSRQVYRGLDIGTGKVTIEEMVGIPHHMIDVADPSDVYTAADFVRDAEDCVQNILSDQHVPILAGGTFFYLDLLRGKTQSAPVAPNSDLRKELETLPTEVLFEKLKTSDPKRADAIDANNRRRLMRALEIVDALGTVPDTQTHSKYEWLIIGIHANKEALAQKIHNRLFERLEGGMIDEVKQLHQSGLAFDRMEDLGLEYRYIARYLQDLLSYEELVEQLENKIRQYAKRQMTWLKRDQDIEWYDLDNTGAIYTRVEEYLKEQAG